MQAAIVYQPQEKKGLFVNYAVEIRCDLWSAWEFHVHTLKWHQDRKGSYLERKIWQNTNKCRFCFLVCLVKSIICVVCSPLIVNHVANYLPDKQWMGFVIKGNFYSTEWTLVFLFLIICETSKGNFSCWIGLNPLYGTSFMILVKFNSQ